MSTEQSSEPLDLATNKRSILPNESTELDSKKSKTDDIVDPEKARDIEFRRSRGKLHKYAILLSYNGKGYYGIQR